MVNFKKIGLSSLVAVSIALSGCASIKDAPISKDVTSVDTSKESIAFMTVRVSNQKSPSYQPNMKYAFVWEDKVSDRKKYSFKVEDPTSKSDGKYNEYLVSFQVKPGEYVVRELFAQSGFFPVIGTFGVPVFKKVVVPANKVVYLGHVDATVVDRTSDEQLRAGPVVPLIDQAVVGASGGTFKIDIQDKYDADTAFVKGKYPAFSAVGIENMTLSQWVKPTEKEMN